MGIAPAGAEESTEVLYPESVVVTPEDGTPTRSWRDRMLDRLRADAGGSASHDPVATPRMMPARDEHAPALVRWRDRLPDGFGRTLGLYSGIAGIATILCIGVMAAGSWYVLSPTTLRIALPPGGEAGVMRAVAERLDRRRIDLRLEAVEMPDVRASAEAMRAGRVDLAVVQPDILYPGNAGTVAILRQEAIVLLSRTHEKGVSQLNGKRIAVLTSRASDADLVRQILGHYQVTAANVAIVAPDGADMAPVDAVFLVTTPGTEHAQRLVRTASSLLGEGATIVPLRAAEIIARTLPDLSEMTLPPNALGLFPEEEVKTMGLSYRLVAAGTLDRAVVSHLTELLFRMRAAIAEHEPAINLMQPPDNDTAMTARLPNHRGTIDYLNREQVTFMTRYGDWIWLGLFAGGGVTSFFGWLAQMLARKRREAIDEVLDRLLRILSEARQSSSAEKLNDLALEIDGLLARAIHFARHHTTNTHTMGSLIVALDGARAAVADRRRELISEALEAAPPRRASRRSA